MTETERYVERLASLKEGERSMLRRYVGRDLDETVDAFDLFAGLWWPLRQRSPKAPRREVAWLVAKTHAMHPIPQARGLRLAAQLPRCRPQRDREQGRRFDERFDRMLTLSLAEIEHDLQWAVGCLAAKDLPLDWARLIDDLSIWHRESKRLMWAKEYLENVRQGA